MFSDDIVKSIWQHWLGKGLYPVMGDITGIFSTGRKMGLQLGGRTRGEYNEQFTVFVLASEGKEIASNSEILVLASTSHKLM